MGRVIFERLRHCGYERSRYAKYDRRLLFLKKLLLRLPAGIDFFECGRYNHNIDRDFQGCKR